MLHKTKFGGFRTNGSHFSPLSGGQSRNLLRRLSCAFLAIVTANCLSTSAAQVASAPGSTATPLPPNSRGIQQQARKARHAHPPAPAASGYAAADAHAAGARCRRGGGAPGGRHHYRADPEGTSRPAPPRAYLLGFGRRAWLGTLAALACFAKKRTSTSPRVAGSCARRASLLFRARAPLTHPSFPSSYGWVFSAGCLVRARLGVLVPFPFSQIAGLSA